MRKTALGALTLGACCSLSAQGVPSTSDPLLIIEEQDDNGVTRRLSSGVAVSDISSVLSIHLNSDKLALRLAGSTDNPSTANLISQAGTLKDLALQGNADLTELSGKLAKHYATNASDGQALQAILDPMGRRLLRILEIAESNPELDRALNEALERLRVGQKKPPILAQYQAILEGARKEAERLLADQRALLSKEGAYVQLGAWLITPTGATPLHLNGFDKYPEQEEFIVDRWSLVLKEEQKTELKKLAQAAESIERGDVPKIRDLVPTSLEPIMKAAQECLKSLDSSGDEVVTALDGERADVRRIVLGMSTDMREFWGRLERLRLEYVKENGATRSNLLMDSGNDVAELSKAVSGLAAKLRETTALDLKNVGGPSSAAIQKFLASAQTCEDNIEAASGKPLENLALALASLKSADEAVTSVANFGDEVLKLDVDSLPSTAQLSLNKAGPRQAGDSIVIKVAGGRSVRGREELEVRRIQMFQVLPHFEMVLGLIFAHPVSRTSLIGKFQAAPSYSVLLKNGSRRSITYNKLFNPGIGINLSSLDFNHDDTPELGAGLAISAIRDYVAGGVGLNVSNGIGYWFFGLRIPLPSASWPGASAQ